MRFSKWAWLTIGNASLGLFTCYLYIYLWVAFFMGDSESIWTWGAASSFLIGFIIFFIWNFFMLKQEEKKYWYHGLAAYIITICAFLFFFQYM